MCHFWLLVERLVYWTCWCESMFLGVVLSEIDDSMPNDDFSFVVGNGDQRDAGADSRARLRVP